MKQYKMTREWEILTDMNKPELQDELMRQYGNTNPINYLLSLNFNDKVKLDLPEGVPPYKRDDLTHSDFQGALVHSIHRLKNCLPYVKLKKFGKEKIFIEMLESIPPESAEILIFCKDKALQELFPNITKELVEKHHPHLVGKKDEAQS